MGYCLRLLVCALGLAGCTAVYTDASDANHVTFLNTKGESMVELTKQANAYCEQYGKFASFRKSESQMLAIFDCKLAR